MCIPLVIQWPNPELPGYPFLHWKMYQTSSHWELCAIRPELLRSIVPLVINIRSIYRSWHSGTGRRLWSVLLSIEDGCMPWMSCLVNSKSDWRLDWPRMHCSGVILSCTTAANYHIVVCTFEMKLLNKPFSSRYSFYFLHLLRSREKKERKKKKKQANRRVSRWTEQKQPITSTRRIEVSPWLAGTDTPCVSLGFLAFPWFKCLLAH